MPDLQRHYDGAVENQDLLRTSITARKWAEGRRTRDEQIARQAADAQAKADAQRAATAAELADNRVVDLTTPEARAAYAAATDQHHD